MSSTLGSVCSCGATFASPHVPAPHRYACLGSTSPTIGDLYRLGEAQYVWTGCVEWRKKVNAQGYGRLSDATAAVLGERRAHRAAWVVVNGPIPDGLLVRHRCDNAACVNVDHLELGTTADNMADKRVRNRSANGHGPKGVRKVQERTCAVCGSLFAVRASRPTVTCGRSCGQRYAADSRKANR